MSKQTRKILNEDTTQSYNAANKQLLNIIKKKVANDGKSTNLFSQLHQKQNNEMLNTDLNAVKKKRTQLAIKQAQLNPDGQIMPAIPQIPQQVATNFTIASQKSINIMNHILGILRSLDVPPPGNFNVNRDIKWVDLFDAFTQLQQQTIYLLQGQGQYKSNQIVQQIDLVSSKYIQFSEVVNEYQHNYVDANNRPIEIELTQWIIDDSIWNRLDIIDEFLLNAQNQLQIFRDGLTQGGPFDDNTQGPIPPVYSYPIYQNQPVPAIAPRVGAPNLRHRRYDLGEEDGPGDDSGYYSDDFLSFDGSVPSALGSDDFNISSDDDDDDDAFRPAALPPADFGITPSRVMSTPARPGIAGKSPHPTLSRPGARHGLDTPRPRNSARGPFSPSPDKSGTLLPRPSAAGPFTQSPNNDRNDGQRRGMMFQLEEQNQLLDRGEITGMQQSESQRQHSFDSRGDIFSGLPSTYTGPFSAQPSGEYVSPSSPVPIRVIEKAQDTQQKERLRFARDSVRELESQAPTSQPQFTTPRQRSRNVSIRDNMEDIEAEERDQLAPRHRLFADDDVEIIADTKPAAGLTSSEREIESAIMNLAPLLREMDFESISEYMMETNLSDKEFEKVSRRLQFLQPDEYSAFIDYMASRENPSPDSKQPSKAAENERLLNAITVDLITELGKRNFDRVELRLSDMSHKEKAYVVSLLTELEAELMDEFNEYILNKPSEKGVEPSQMDLPIIKRNLTKWYNENNITAFKAWKQQNIINPEQEKNIIETLTTSRKNSYGDNYGKMYLELMSGRGKQYRASSRRGTR